MTRAEARRIRRGRITQTKLTRAPDSKLMKRAMGEAGRGWDDYQRSGFTNGWRSARGGELLDDALDSMKYWDVDEREEKRRRYTGFEAAFKTGHAAGLACSAPRLSFLSSGAAGHL